MWIVFTENISLGTVEFCQVENYAWLHEISYKNRDFPAIIIIIIIIKT